MAERDGYIPGVPCWIDTNRTDPAASYFVGRIRGGDVGAVGSGAEGDAAWNTYIWVASADDAARAARNAGGTVVVEPMDVMDAGRMAVIVDPEGAAFSVWEPKRHRGSRVVNEHGSVNFNNLETRDPESAQAFYGAVFGWKLVPLGSGTAWALPGYGDHLEESTPGLRANMAQMGAPDGFVDVVAAVAPIAGDDGDTPAHWSVTFAVDDVDATASRATELGGRVVSGPVDAPWTRTATIEDPQGARFIASQFVPENRDISA
jgi:predicted enzyme related to lactoylglutathione lyase